jgi:hypothetical protein
MTNSVFGFRSTVSIMRSQIRLSALIALFTVFLALSIPLAAAGVPAVKAWETTIVIPTYLAGDPEPDPMFYFGRSSHGAQAPVYPYPLSDVLTGKKADKTYKIVYLENEYLRIGILPEIGGCIFEVWTRPTTTISSIASTLSNLP